MEQPCSEQDPVVDLTQARWVRAYAEDSTAPSAGLWLDSIHRIGRPGSDSLAAWGKWHQGTCDKWFDGDKIVWYHALESARVECLTAAELPGAAANLKSIVMEPKAGTSGPGDLYRMARATWGLEFQCVSGRGHPPVRGGRGARPRAAAGAGRRGRSAGSACARRPRGTRRTAGGPRRRRRRSRAWRRRSPRRSGGARRGPAGGSGRERSGAREPHKIVMVCQDTPEQLHLIRE